MFYGKLLMNFPCIMTASSKLDYSRCDNRLAAQNFVHTLHIEAL